MSELMTSNGDVGIECPHCPRTDVVQRAGDSFGERDGIVTWAICFDADHAQPIARWGDFLRECRETGTPAACNLPR